MKYLFLLLIVFLSNSFTAGQLLNEIASYNIADVSGMPDNDRPWSTEKGCRSVIYAGDIDNDGKQNFIATDYTNGGRVHLLELNSAGNKLDIVWSSPVRNGVSSGSTPRWVQTGDLDGDGLKEIIFPLTTTAADYAVHVFEHQGSDNNFGTSPAFVLQYNAFASLGIGNFRTNRERGMVFDFDSDGRDEFIMSNRDYNVYILGVTGLFPGTEATWQVEGGHPSQVPANSSTFSMVPWQSLPADLSGDGNMEIVNHHWNFYGFWSVKPSAPDSYIYPNTTLPNFYAEIFRNAPSIDAVAYMGFDVVDVDGDGSDEIAGILYGGSSENYSLALIDFSATDTGLYVWQQSQGGIIVRNAWSVSGASTGTLWGLGSADLNGNGREEIFLGGNHPYEIIAVEYKGTGSLLDTNSYNTYVLHSSIPQSWYRVDVYNNQGVIDSVFIDPPFISKISAGIDMNGNGKKELVASYQNVYDSTIYRYFNWSTSSGTFVLDSTVKRNNFNIINVKVFESTLPATPYSMTVTAPAGGANILSGSLTNLTWTSAGVGKIALDYSTNNGTVWIPITTYLSAINGSYAWRVPKTPSTRCLIRITDLDNKTVAGVSSSPFTINTVPGWAPAPDLPNRMTVFAKVMTNDIPPVYSNNPEDILAAFVIAGADTQCRGVAYPQSSGLYSLSIYSPVASGERLYFKYYNKSGNAVVRIMDESLVFANQGVVGSVSSPYIFNTNPVPVELVSFKATVSGKKVVLEWQTATETNNSGFYIERKTEEGEFLSAGFIQGSGTSPEEASYSFTDNPPSPGKYFYRLKQVDFDGTYSYSSSIEADLQTPLEFALSQNYPNPFNPTTVISYQISVNSHVTLKLFDVLGNEMATLIDENKAAGYHSYQLSSVNHQLTSGVYFYKLQAGEFVQTRKMILIK
ncbi:MAG: FG-GAP-like repeat-containing protein [Ignavibacteriaceae bacterium]